GGGHRPDEDDEAVVTARVDVRVGLAVEVQVTDAEARTAELLVERAERLERHVLKNEKLTDRALLPAGARLLRCAQRISEPRAAAPPRAARPPRPVKR